MVCERAKRIWAITCDPTATPSHISLTVSLRNRRGIGPDGRTGVQSRVMGKYSYRIRPAFERSLNKSARGEWLGSLSLDRDIGWQGNLFQESFIIIVWRIDPL